MTTWADPTGVINQGQFLKATVLQNALNNDLSMATVCLARKTGPETVANNTTPQDDDNLFFSPSAGELWNLRFIFRVAAGAAVDVDFKVQFDVNADAQICFEGAVLNASGGLDILRWFSTATTQVFNVASTTPSLYVVNGLLYMGATSGVFKVKWAQGNSSATTTGLFAGSCILGTMLGTNPRL